MFGPCGLEIYKNGPWVFIYEKLKFKPLGKYKLANKVLMVTLVKLQNKPLYFSELHEWSLCLNLNTKWNLDIKLNQTQPNLQA